MERPSLIYCLMITLLAGCTAAAQEETTLTLIIPPAEQEIRPAPLPPVTDITEPPATALLLSVPFSSQAPYDVWDQFYNETCEEMSLLMVLGYLHGFAFTPESTDASLRDIVAWEEARNWGDSITIADVAQMAEERYDVRAVLHEEVSIRTIERLLRDGHPVIIPAAGRQLLNPYFRDGGPWYHMLVIIGYDEQSFITHDPGTAYGKEYAYPKQLLIDAIHDWTGVPERIEEGRKVMMTVSTEELGIMIKRFP